MTTPTPPFPESLWSTASPELQAAILALVQAYQERIDQLEAQVADLRARLQLNSTNSSKPPSSDPIGLKRKPPAPPSGRKRGGQPGHHRVQRSLVPPEKVRTITDCRPTDCRRCGHALVGDDPAPLVHQVAELPKIEPLVDEYRLHRLACPQCGVTTCGSLPAGGSQGCFGPYLQAVLSTIAGGYRLSKRQIQQMVGDLFSLSIATGMVSKLERQSATVLEAPYNEVALGVHDAPAASIDDTSWRENRRKAQLWVVVTALTTVFTIAAKRSAAVAKAVLGSKPNQVVTSDRHSSLEWIDPEWRQICWSHLNRDFQAMIDRGGAGEATGRALLHLSKRMFRWWHRFRDGTIDRQRFKTVAARRQGCAGRRPELRLRQDSSDVLRDSQGGGGSVDLRARRGDRADEQRFGTRAAPCRDLAPDQWGDGQCRWQPVRGADADGGGHLPPAEAQRAGLSQLVLRGALARPEGPVPAAGKLTGYAYC